MKPFVIGYETIGRGGKKYPIRYTYQNLASQLRWIERHIGAIKQSMKNNQPITALQAISNVHKELDKIDDAFLSHVKQSYYMKRPSPRVRPSNIPGAAVIRDLCYNFLISEKGIIRCIYRSSPHHLVENVLLTTKMSKQEFIEFLYDLPEESILSVTDARLLPAIGKGILSGGCYFPGHTWKCWYDAFEWDLPFEEGEEEKLVERLEQFYSECHTEVKKVRDDLLK